MVAKGTSLGPYEILSHLGSGGMGEVWRARDRRIGRDVAVKVLPESFAHGEELLQRFELEARAAGALNHPGLVTIFDVGTTDGAPYIVMELLEGQTLRAVLEDAAPAALPVRKAVDYAIQIASALAVAHEKGIVHRDLKPDNIFVTADRRVKILDFGLAKLAVNATDADGRRHTAKHLTSAGFIVGTPGYMSPEQVRAAPLDHRTDIFSLGSVLYEMLAGRPAFEGESVIETMHAVLADEPPPLEKPDVSPGLEAALRRCLEKDPGARFQSARDLAFHLQSLPEMQRGTTTTRREAVRPGWSRRYRAAVLVLPLLVAGAAGGFVLQAFRGRSSVAVPRGYKQLTSADGMELFPTFAPDGKSFAYASSISGNRDIYVQRVEGRTPINLTADSPDNDSEPAFSPDGSQIAFRSERDGGGLFVMGATGESPRRLTDMGHNPAWSPDGTQIVFATEEVEMLPWSRGRRSELWVYDLRTAAQRPLVQPQEGGPEFGRDSDCVQPSWSPSGKRIACWGHSSRAGLRDIWTIDPTVPEPKKSAVRVTSVPGVHWNPVWSPDGKYLYYGSDVDGTLNLWRVAMDEETGSPVGAPEPVGLPASAAGNFAFARSGEMAYVTMTRSYHLLAMPFDVNAGTIGTPRQLFGSSQEIATFRPSPDGKTIAFTANEDLFVAEADGTRIRQLIMDAAKDRAADWSADGETLFFFSNRGGGSWNIWSIHADGSGLTRITDDADLKRIGSPNVHTPVASPDGRTLIVGTDRDVSALIHLDRAPGQRLELLPRFLPQPKWSPDGQLIVAREREQESLSGAIVLYSLRTHRAERLPASGSAPHWTPDGRKVVYFERQEVRVLDLASRATTSVPFTALPGGEIDLRGVTSYLSRDVARLSRDGATLYVRQEISQSDIWMVRFPPD